MEDLEAEREPLAEPPPRVGAGLFAASQMAGGDILLRRWLGCWIDFLCLAVLILLPALLLNGLAASVATAAADLLIVAYFPVTEGRWGRTVGKLATGTIVVDAEGRVPGFGRAAVRTLTRLVEVNPLLLGGLPAGLVTICTANRQRLGDLAAGTYVVPFKCLPEARVRAEWLNARAQDQAEF